MVQNIRVKYDVYRPRAYNMYVLSSVTDGRTSLLVFFFFWISLETRTNRFKFVHCINNIRQIVAFVYRARLKQTEV